MLWETWASLAQDSFSISLQATGHSQVPYVAIHPRAVIGDTVRDRDSWDWKQPQGTRADGAVSANTWGSAPNIAAYPQGLNPCPG